MKGTLSILVVCALTGRCFADQTSDFKNFIKAMIPKVEQAVQTGDTKFFDQIAAPGFIERSMGRAYTLQQSNSMMKQALGGLTHIHVKIDLLSATAAKDTATALIHVHFSAATKPDSKGKSHQLGIDSNARETWVRMGKSWRIKLMDDFKMTQTYDGKLLPAKPRK